MRLSLFWNILLRGSLLLLIALCVAFWYFESVYLSPGRFHREQMNAIVNEIRHRQFPDEGPDGPLGLDEFQLNDFDNPKSAVQVFDSGPRNIWVMRDEKGVWTIIIMTVDHDHLGEYGFVYSDGPVPPLAGFQEWWKPIKQVDPHWWKAADLSL